MTTYSTNTFMDSSNDTNYQAWVGEILTAIYTQLGLPASGDVCMLSTSNYNASIVVNAQTATNQLTVNSVTSGGNNICIGMTVVGAGIAAGVTITAVGTGTGGTGTYTLSSSVGTIAAESMTISLKAPNTGTSANRFGSTMFKFNDTLQATAPIFCLLTFGSGAGSASGNAPLMWATVGTGSNGSGVITTSGWTGTNQQSACGWGNTVGQSTINYTSRYCYNATQGFFGMALKLGQGASIATVAMFGLFIYRSVNSSGAPTGDSVMMLTNQPGVNGSSTAGYCTVYAYNNTTIYGGGTGQTLGPAGTATGYQDFIVTPPFAAVQTQLGGTTMQVLPVYQMAPGGATGPANLGITNQTAFCGNNEIAVNSTVTVTILGSTSLTYMAVGPCFGYTQMGGISTFQNNYSFLMLWQ